MRTLDIERVTGIRARFLVYYTRGGRRYVDCMYGATEERVRADFLGMARELGWTVEIQRIEVR